MNCEKEVQRHKGTKAQRQKAEGSNTVRKAYYHRSWEPLCTKNMTGVT